MKIHQLNNSLLSLEVLDYGAIIHSLKYKKTDGNTQELIKGYSDIIAYKTDEIYRGACVGRVAGRISGGGFHLNGKQYPLYHSNGVHLHGGEIGFSKHLWKVTAKSEGLNPQITLERTSVHGEEGYPGNLAVWVRYTLNGDNLIIEHGAETDHTTIVNLTNHSYFQLDGSPNISHYQLQINSKGMAELGPDLLPTGEIIKPAEYFDFSKERNIGKTQLDSIFVVDKSFNPLAKVYSPLSNIGMELISNQDCLVVYTMKGDGSICFEAQGFPNAVNQPNFPEWTLRPGEQYHHHMKFRFFEKS